MPHENRRISSLSKLEKQRFFKYTQVDPSTGCLNWVGALVFGYGKFKLRGLSERSHRVAFAIYHGECPAEIDVMHDCDNPKCVAEMHLSPGDDARNNGDKATRGRAARLAGKLNGRAKLTDEQVRIIFVDPRPQRVIAGEYGITQASVSFIKHRQQWQDTTKDLIPAINPFGFNGL